MQNKFLDRTWARLIGWIDSHTVTVLLYSVFAILIGLWVVVEAEAASKCDAYEQGFRDGYCLEERFTCYPPVPPLCSEMWYDNDMQAYHAGMEDGKERRR